MKISARHWLSQDQYDALMSRKNDPFIVQVIAAIDRCHSERQVLDMLVSCVIGQSMQNQHLSKLLTDMAMVSKTPMIMPNAVLDRAERAFFGHSGLTGDTAK
jgi:hypothetical protein